MASKKGTTIFVNIEELEEGDIIEFVRADGLYFHCGIYDGEHSVFHRAAEPGAGSRAAIDSHSIFAKLGIESDKAEIRKDDLRVVAGSSFVFRNNMFDSVIRPLSGKEILKRANERLGEKGYNLLYKNCQHFCTEIRYGTSINMQVEATLGLRTCHSYESSRVLVNIVKLPGMPDHLFSSRTANTESVQPGHPEIIENMPDQSLRHFLSLSRKQQNWVLAVNISADVLAAMMAFKNNTCTSTLKRELYLMRCVLSKDLTISNKSLSDLPQLLLSDSSCLYALSCRPQPSSDLSAIKWSGDAVSIDSNTTVHLTYDPTTSPMGSFPSSQPSSSRMYAHKLCNIPTPPIDTGHIPAIGSTSVMDWIPSSQPSTSTPTLSMDFAHMSDTNSTSDMGLYIDRAIGNVTDGWCVVM